MKKIIIPFDGEHFSKGAFSFVKDMQEMNPVLLTGIFLPEIDYARFFFFPTAFAGPVYMPVLHDSDEEDVEHNVSDFAMECEKNGIEYRVHKDVHDFSIAQLSTESRFADLMIIGSESFYKDGSQYGTNEYLKGALHNTECPVIIVPEVFDFPSQIVLAYDGSESSVFAIKQFAYLFPELCKLKTILVYAGNEKNNIPEQVSIEELAARHYSDLTITKFNSDNKRDLDKFFGQFEKTIVVSGSFSRTRIAEFFSKSFVMDIIKRYRTPVFIAHK